MRLPNGRRLYTAPSGPLFNRQNGYSVFSPKIGYLKMGGLGVIHRTEFEKDRVFLRQIQKTELRNQIAKSSRQVKNLADEGLEYLTIKESACKDVVLTKNTRKKGASAKTSNDCKKSS